MSAPDHPYSCRSVLRSTRRGSSRGRSSSRRRRDPDYTLLGNRATLGGAHSRRTSRCYGAFQYAQLLGLPRACRPVSRPARARRRSTTIPPRDRAPISSISSRCRSALRTLAGLSFEVGRMGFVSGAESRPRFAGARSARARSSARPAARRCRLDDLRARVRRRRASIWRPRWHAHCALLLPSQGAFEESANPTMSGVRVATASVTSGTRAAAADVADARRGAPAYPTPWRRPVGRRRLSQVFARSIARPQRERLRQHRRSAPSTSSSAPSAAPAPPSPARRASTRSVWVARRSLATGTGAASRVERHRRGAAIAGHGALEAAAAWRCHATPRATTGPRRHTWHVLSDAAVTRARLCWPASSRR